MTRSAADIISLSTGRESLLIGPPSAFGVQSRDLVIRDRQRALAVLELFLTRPHADQLLRPHLRRWGFDPVALQYSDRARMIEQMSRAVSGGNLALAVVPEVTLAFAAAQDRPVAVRPASLSAPRPHLPDSLQERMVLVLEMVPDHLQGEMLLAFKNAVDGRVEQLAIGVVAWVGAHFVPGLNLAILAFDLFCLSGDVIQALETLVTVIRDVRNAGSLEDLKPSARLLAGAIATLIAEGILSRLLKAQTHTRGVGKAGGHPDRKPSPQKTPQRQVEPRRPRDEDQGSVTDLWQQEEISKAKSVQEKSPGSGRRQSDKEEVSGVSYERPSGYRVGVRDQVWENAVKASSDGRVRDPKTGRIMSKEDAWDMGHLPGHEFRRIKARAKAEGMSRKQFLDIHNDPNNYRPELPSSNRSHALEDMSDDF